MKQFHDAKVRLPISNFHSSKNYGSLTHETRLKDAVNMEDLICLLATVRTLKGGFTVVTVILGTHSPDSDFANIHRL